MIQKNQITAVILAGGRGRRMQGEDKGLIAFQGRPLIEHILTALTPQVSAVVINANRNLTRYAAYGLPVISDELADYQGPLAGFAAAMRSADTPYILTLPCDAPTVAETLVPRLTSALVSEQAEIAVAHDGQRIQPVYALLPTALLPSLQRFLDNGDRKIDLWYQQHRTARADFSDNPAIFHNINTPEERLRLQAKRTRS